MLPVWIASFQQGSDFLSQNPVQCTKVTHREFIFLNFPSKKLCESMDTSLT